MKEKFTFSGFKDFIEKDKRSICFVVLFLVFAFGMKLFHVSISHDTEAIMAVPESLYYSWLSMGRFGLIVLKKLFGTYWFNPYIASVFMFFSMIGAAIVWSYLFYVLSEGKRSFLKVNWIFPVILLTPAVMAEQVSFLLQAFEVCFALLFVGLALIFVWKAILEKKYFYYVLAVSLAAISFSCYQTFVPMFIAGAIVCFLLVYDLNCKENFLQISYWSVILKLFLSFVMSLGVYQVTKAVILNYLNIEPTSYISGQVLWGEVPPTECISNILNHVTAVLRGAGVYYYISFSFVCIGMFLYSLLRCGRKTKEYYLYVLALLALLASPFYMSIIMGNEPNFRTQLVLPFVTGFLLQYLVLAVMNIKHRMARYIQFGMIFITILFCINQSMITARMFYTEYVQYEEDTRLAVKITDRIDQLNLGERPEEPLVFVGSRSPQLNQASMYGLENVGRSFYEFAFTTEYGSFIMRNYFSTLGYNYNEPTKEEITRAVTAAEQMETWPNAGSVQCIDGIIIVKFSEP